MKELTGAATTTTIDTHNHQQQQQQQTPLPSQQQPSYLRWSLNIDELVNDDLGRRIFSEYLKQSHNDNLYTLYMALKCFLAQSSEDEEKLKRVFEATYNSCYKNREIKLQNELIQKRLSQALEQKKYDYDLFDKCELILKEHLNNEFYLKFLQSDIYKRALQLLNSQNSQLSIDLNDSNKVVDEQQYKIIIDFIFNESQSDKAKFIIPNIPTTNQTINLNVNKQPQLQAKQTKSKSKTKLNESSVSKK